MSGWRVYALGIGLAAVMACSPTGTYHRVRQGENLYRIGLAYGVSHTEIARANGIRDPKKVREGQRLFIPGGSASRRVAKASAGPAPRRSRGRAVARPAPPPPERNAPSLGWPVARGQISSGFGPRGDAMHDGIDIAAPLGTPVRAAAAGEVAYSGALPGYGNVIIVRHDARYATVYAHNHRNHVRKGQRLKRGQQIGTVGRTGRATGPNLHFEVRYHDAPRDPMRYLPRSGLAAVGR